MQNLLLLWLMSAMTLWCPWMVRRPSAEQRIATATLDATSDPLEAAELAAIGSLESGYDERARGRHGEVGIWQLMPPVPVACLSKDRAIAIRAQAQEAVRRWRAQGSCGYTGEMRTAPVCPLAANRIARAHAWYFAHPPPSAVAPIALSLTP